MITVTRVSALTGVKHTREIPCSSEEMQNWLSNRSLLIQDAFPNLTADQREFILTGITPEEWATLVSTPEGDE